MEMMTKKVDYGDDNGNFESQSDRNMQKCGRDSTYGGEKENRFRGISLTWRRRLHSKYRSASVILYSLSNMFAGEGKYRSRSLRVNALL